MFLLGNSKKSSKKNIKIDPKIPLNIFQSWHTLELPPLMKNAIELLKYQNPEFKHFLYDDEMCRDFIEKNFDKDVLYSFNKLKPGAYKCDLWRYCILYKYGGIYLDVKYICANGFRLIELTDKEYFVRDKMYKNEIGIYQAFIACQSNNKILYNCIQSIVENVKNNTYCNNDLCVTGPLLISKYFHPYEIENMDLNFDGKSINNKDKPILQIYDNYRKEQQSNQKTEYYYHMWMKKDIYNYAILNPKARINLSKTMNVCVLNKNIEIYSGTPTIIDISNNYLINLRWINYNYNEYGGKIKIPKQWISINSRFLVDQNFNKISDEYFLKENFMEQLEYIGVGLEDIRIFKFNDEHYYMATFFDNNRKMTSVSSGKYNMDEESYKLEKNIILPTLYDTNKNKIIEKNWSYVNYKSELCIVYNWFPLRIGKIDYNEKNMNIFEIRQNIPEYFKEARGSTSGIDYNNEIWFVLHKAQKYDLHYKKQGNTFYNYQHFFAVFDLDMNLLRYSELFKFEDCKVEFCIGMIIQNDELILSYSALDTKSIIAKYDIDYIKKGIKWYDNNYTDRTV